MASHRQPGDQTLLADIRQAPKAWVTPRGHNRHAGDRIIEHLGLQ